MAANWSSKLLSLVFKCLFLVIYIFYNQRGYRLLWEQSLAKSQSYIISALLFVEYSFSVDRWHYAVVTNLFSRYLNAFSISIQNCIYFPFHLIRYGKHISVASQTNWGDGAKLQHLKLYWVCCGESQGYLRLHWVCCAEPQDYLNFSCSI